MPISLRHTCAVSYWFISLRPHIGFPVPRSTYFITWYFGGYVPSMSPAWFRCELGLFHVQLYICMYYIWLISFQPCYKHICDTEVIIHFCISFFPTKPGAAQIMNWPGRQAGVKLSGLSWRSHWIWWSTCLVSLVSGLEHGFHVSIYWESHHPNWRTRIFQRDRYTTNQLFV